MMLRGEEDESVIIELLHTGRTQLDRVAGGREGVEVIDAATLLTSWSNGEKMGRLLAALEAEGIVVKQIRYGTTTLESLFLRLTSQGNSDA